MTSNFPNPWMEINQKPAPQKPVVARATKELQTARCCWVCGKLGGEGFTRALRNAGYPVGKGQMAYAHAACMIRANKRAVARAKAKAKKARKAVRS